MQGTWELLEMLVIGPHAETGPGQGSHQLQIENL